MKQSAITKRKEHTHMAISLSNDDVICSICNVKIGYIKTMGVVDYRRAAWSIVENVLKQEGSKPNYNRMVPGGA